MNLFELICNPSWIQAIASLILLIITIIYVILTSKLVHAPHTAFLQPDNIYSNNSLDQWSIKIKNFGPGIAVSVRVYIRISSNITFAPTEKNPQRIFVGISWVEAKGPSTISNGNTESYKFNGFISSLMPIRAEWKLITGKRRREFWFYKVGIDDKFLTKEGMDKIAYYHNRLFESIKSPYYKMIKSYYLRKSKKVINEKMKT